MCDEIFANVFVGKVEKTESWSLAILLDYIEAGARLVAECVYKNELISQQILLKTPKNIHLFFKSPLFNGDSRVYVCQIFELKHTPEAIYMPEYDICIAHSDVVSLLCLNQKHFVSHVETKCFLWWNKMFLYDIRLRNNLISNRIDMISSIYTYIFLVMV